MGTIIDKLLLVIDAKFNALKQLFKGVDAAANLDKELRKAEKAAKKVDKAIGGVGRKFFGLGLGMLFTGMALKNFAQGALRELTNVFITLADEQDSGVQKTLELQAAFQFLKFTIFETLSQTDLFINFVTFLVSAAIWMANFTEKHPVLAKILGLFLVLFIIIGSLATPMGQLLLLWIGLAAVWESLTFLMFLGVLLVLMSAIVAIFLVWNSDMTTMAKIIATVEIAILALIFILLILHVTITLPLFAAIFLIGLVVIAFFFLASRVGGIKNAFKSMGLTILFILAVVADAIFFTLIAPLKAVITLINTVIRLINKTVVGRKFGLKEIEAPEPFALSKKVLKMRNELLDEIALDEANKKVEEFKAAEAAKVIQEKGLVEGVVPGEQQPFTLDDVSLEKLGKTIAEGNEDFLSKIVDIIPSTEE